MIVSRRSYMLPTIILICLTYILFSSLPPGARTPHGHHHHHHKQHLDEEPPHKNTRFRWVKHVEQFPISKYIPLPTAPSSPIPRIQYKFPRESWFARWGRTRRQRAVKKAFKHAWKGYKENAWLRDELSPLSGGHRETFAGWAATLVDSLDTLVIMDLMDEFEEALEAIEQIDFTTTDAIQINVFETNIRYLGGLLGAYDLTHGKYPILLQKATEIADMIYGCFDTHNRMPQSRWEWTRSAGGLNIEASRNTILAEIGSLNLEFTRMSQLTKDPKYFDAIQRIANFLEEEQPKTKVPGMWPMMVNARDLELADPRFTIGGMADSTYEYLPKEHMLLGGQTNQYRKMYDSFMGAMKSRLLFRPMTEDGRDILFAGNLHAGASKINMEPQWEHLKCFLGGTVGIGSKVFDRPEELSIARKLVDGCIWAYDVMPTGIMPEILHLTVCKEGRSCKLSQNSHSSSDAESIAQGKKLPPGVADIPDPQYLLRPEAIESVFIMYRITGDNSLQDSAWRMFQNIERMARTAYGHAAIADVRDPESPLMDYMESFWLAETLKYFYLTFSEPDLVNLDEYVLNTEAHPFRRPSAYV
ncbi:glycosyl hydrolase family 47 protein [Aspergillus heteromorphus CBS 117.55]|uniref:alpha-1,2-Mannosidase n=1 Tax=Aspergillus heteromorphus CBS 117.55 TaxID=1448321 RepID=A0A317WRI1_9EURO|nr:glycosyl hydrolase family 47 protein [Aspergillus heteromorphus CBS 117.55]PWY87737.1 glycosyl hydrolase family 47 protein [Aspergillus heteromorphus CBS 117.55]